MSLLLLLRGYSGYTPPPLTFTVSGRVERNQTNTGRVERSQTGAGRVERNQTNSGRIERKV